MDEIAVDLLTEWVRQYNLTHDDTLDRAAITDWDVHKFCKPESGKEVYKILRRPGLFDHLPPQRGAVEAITELVESGHDVRFATSTPSADAARGKVEWVTRMFKHLNFGISNIIQMADKVWLAPSVDVLVDDKPQTIMEWRKYSDEQGRTGPRIMTIRHPHNDHVAHLAHVVGEDYTNTEKAWLTILGALHHLAEERQ
jgi:5'(3')-deoxyribonucleotidase